MQNQILLFGLENKWLPSLTLTAHCPTWERMFHLLNKVLVPMSQCKIRFYSLWSLRMSDRPSLTLIAQPENGCSTYWTGFYGESTTPRCHKYPWGDLVVPLRWRQWVNPWIFLPFATFHLKDWREIMHQVVRKDQLDPLPQRSEMREP